MGLLKTENHEHKHTHIDKDAAKEIAKGQLKAAEKMADAQRREAYAQERIAEEQELTKRKLANQAKKSEVEEYYRELSASGLASDYIKLYKAWESAEEDYFVKQNKEGSANLSDDELETYLDGFAYDKSPVEFRKIIVFLDKEKDFERMKLLKGVAQAHVGEPEYEETLSVLNKRIKELEEEKAAKDEKDMRMIKKIFIWIGIGFAVFFIAGGIDSCVRDYKVKKDKEEYWEREREKERNAENAGAMQQYEDAGEMQQYEDAGAMQQVEDPAEMMQQALNAKMNQMAIPSFE